MNPLQKSFCDLELVTKDGTRLKTNSILLAKIGMNITKESKSCILLEEADRDVVDVLEAHVNGKSFHLEPITIWKVVRFAKRYHLQSLLEECFNYFQDNVTLNSCANILNLLQNQPDYNSIKSKVYHFMRINFCELFRLNHFLEVYEGTMFRQLLDDDCLNVQSETTVWEAIDQWINRKDEQRMHLFGDLVKALRFGRLPIDYLMNITKSSSVAVSTGPNRTLIKSMITEHSKLQSNYTDGYGFPACRQIGSIRPRTPYSIVWLFGGWKGGNVTDSIETYDPNTNLWFESQMPGIGLARTYYALEQDVTGLLYIIGGTDGAEILDTLISYSPIEKRCTFLTPMTECRCYVSSASLNGCIYAIGGHNGINRLDTCERYDLARDAWTLVATMNVIRSDASAVAFNGKVYVAGGMNVEDVEKSVEVYDPQSDRWTLIEYMRTPRSCFSLIVYNKAMYALGGYNGTERIATCERYDFKLKCWSAVQPMLCRRSTFRATVLNDSILVAGGYDEENTIDNAEVYNDKSDGWKAISNLRGRRSGFAITTLSGLSNAAEYTFNGSNNTI